MKKKLFIMPKAVYKRYWKVNLKNPYVVIKHHDVGTKKEGFIPQKTFKTKSAAQKYIKKYRK